MDAWSKLAHDENERIAAAHHAMTTGGPMPPMPEAIRRRRGSLLDPGWDVSDVLGDEFSLVEAAGSIAERKSKKNKRKMVKATKKAQRKPKKKKKR